MNIINKLNRYIDPSSFEIHIYKDKIHIINYINIKSFSSTKIEVNNVTLIGKDLLITKLNNEEILITGIFNEVVL